MTVEREREPLHRRAPVRDVARPVEVVTAGEQQREDHHRRERAVVDSAQNMQRGRERRHPDRHLPGPMAPPNETTRRNEQRDGGHDTERVGERPDGVGREAANETHVLAGKHGMEQVEERSDGDERAHDGRRALVTPPDSERGRPEPDDHRRQVHGREAGRDIERRAGGDLPHDGDRDAGLQVGIRPDPDGEEQRGGSRSMRAQRA